MKPLDANYWNNRYIEENTPWDTESITTPFKTYFDQIEDKTLKILIPGAGNAHEAAYLHNKEFTNVWVCDWAAKAIEYFKEKNSTFPTEHLICADFFELQGKFDIIIEQTFFCALPPTLRPEYAKKVAQLLKEKGKLVGLLFATSFERQGPPFEGTLAEYSTYFESYFETIVFEKCYNSIPPRKDNEFFMILQKS